MKKTLVKHGSSLAIVIEKAICDLYGLKQGSELDMQVKDNSLVFEGLRKVHEPVTLHPVERKKLINKIGLRIAKRHKVAFKKLAE